MATVAAMRRPAGFTRGRSRAVACFISGGLSAENLARERNFQTAAAVARPVALESRDDRRPPIEVPINAGAYDLF
jgi:hypothetical protein